MTSFRIISFDGGGIRGAISARILKRLSYNYPELIEKTDLFAGTSTGSLIALCLAYGISPDIIDTTYNIDNMKTVFKSPKINPFSPIFSNKGLKKILSSSLPEDLTIGSLKKYVFIPAFNVKGFSKKTWEPVFFNNLSKGNTYDFKVIDAAIASSAAPAYFPSYKDFIDGGVIVNSPSIAAVINTMKYLKPRHNIRDFKVISIGTGRTLDRISKNTSSWGAIQWILNPFTKVKTPIISILLNDSTLSDMYCSELLGSNYIRIDPILNTMIPLDDYKQVPYLKSEADKLNLTSINSYIENIYLK